jgi:drug/metabolite transporter (DMT)-like permease
MSSASETPPHGNAAGAHALPPMGYALLGSLTLFWGLNWPTMKIVLNEMPVWTFRSLCLIAGGGALLIIARLGRRSVRVPTSEIWPLVICSLFNIVGWHLFSGYGVSLIESGRAAIIAFTMPVWAAVLGWFVLGERMTRTGWIGLALGVLGLTVLMGPDLEQLGAAPLGALFMVGAAMSWATGTVFMKRYTWSIPVGVLAGWQLLIGAVPVTIGALLIDPLPNPAALSGPAIAALVYVLALPMVFCHWAWFSVVRLFPAAIAAAGTLAIPVVGVLSGAVVLGEPLGWREMSALVLVCAALVFVLLIPAWRRSARKADQTKR